MSLSGSRSKLEKADDIMEKGFIYFQVHRCKVSRWSCFQEKVKSLFHQRKTVSAEASVCPSSHRRSIVSILAFSILTVSHAGAIIEVAAATVVQKCSIKITFKAQT